MSNSNKIGFWKLLSIVIGAQIGSGAFTLPAILANYGWYAPIGWGLSTLGAISLALVFATLAKNDPITGGPHVYIERAFGERLGFLVGWGYWLVSWISTAAVISTAAGYIMNAAGLHSRWIAISLEIGLLLTFVVINLRGMSGAAMAEAALSLLKFVPLLILPICALRYWNAGNIGLSPENQAAPAIDLIGKTLMMTMWGFIGIESGLAPAGSISNPSRSVPRAIVAGVLITSSLYIFNHIAIAGAIHHSVLANSQAPYAELAASLLGNAAGFVMAILGACVCLGTLNAWILTSSQIMLGLSTSKYFPSHSMNDSGMRRFSVLSSSIGLIPILVLTSFGGIAHQVRSIIDISVVAFLFVYLISCVACIWLRLKRKISYSWTILATTIFALAFSSLTLVLTPMSHNLIAVAVILSGLIPMVMR